MKYSFLISFVCLLQIIIPVSSNAEHLFNRGFSFGQSSCFVINTNSIGFGECLSIVLPGLHEGDDAALPAHLGTLAPNPFNPTVNISFHLEGNAVVELSVFDISGHCVKHLVTKEFAAGENTWQWDGRSDRGTTLPAGVYLVKMKNPKNTDTKKVTLVK